MSCKSTRWLYEDASDMGYYRMLQLWLSRLPLTAWSWSVSGCVGTRVRLTPRLDLRRPGTTLSVTECGRWDYFLRSASVPGDASTLTRWLQRCKHCTVYVHTFLGPMALYWLRGQAVDCEYYRHLWEVNFLAVIERLSVQYRKVHGNYHRLVMYSLFMSFF